MNRRFVSFLLLSFVLGAVQFSAFAGQPAQQKAAGVAGGSRVTRGRNGSVNASSPRYSPAPNDDEATAPGGRAMRDLEALEQQCLDEINEIRRIRHLTKLSFDEDLLPVAREYSRRMAEEHFFSHTDPEGRTVRERVDDAEIKWRVVGENLAYSNGYINPVAASLRSWMESPGHRRNILDTEFRRTAIGAWVAADGTVYFTEIFLKD